MKQTIINISAATALLFALAACTQDDAGFLPEGAEGTPIVFTATGLNTAATATVGTRATVDGDWLDVQTVAIKIGEAVKTYTVTPSTDDNTSAKLSSDDPHYWTGSKQITVSAWWPYDDKDITKMPAVKVAADQSKLENFQKSDFISAENQEVTYGSPILRFTHRTARVTVALKPGTGFTSVAGATVNLMSLSAENENPTAIKTYNISDKSNEVSGNTYTALVAPQSVAEGTTFIEVKLGDGTSTNGKTFVYKMKSTTEWQAGKEYTYTVSLPVETGRGYTVSANDR